MTHLFLFTIGPVQGFIAQARKARDLKAGSQILSELVYAGMRKARKDFGAEVILPYAEAKADSLPNRFLAEVTLPKDELQNIGKAIEEALHNKWYDISTKARQNMAYNSGVNGWKRFDEQLKDHWEAYWVFESVDGPEDYRRAHRQIESNLGAIKNIRPFQQLPPDETHRKCSITGERDAILFSAKAESVPPFVVDKRSRKITEVVAKLNESGIALSNSDKVTLRGGEGLSAVAAVKRFFKSAGFMSTAEVATLNFENKVRDGLGSAVYYDRFKTFLADNHKSDGQLLFSENLRREHLEKQGYKGILGNLDKILHDYRELIRHADQEGITRPKPYYALLTFDGDKMGAIQAGSADYLPETADLKAFQRDLAKHLYDFARQAEDYVNQGRGQAIYAGGDDFTGLINLEYLLDTLQELRRMYTREVSAPMSQRYRLKQPLTFSAGVCIAHYKTDLGEVVRQSKAAEKLAKKPEGGNRDAFALCLMKRSGEVQQASAKWGDEAKAFRNFDALRTCVHLMQAGCFSNTFVSVLNREIQTLVGRNRGIDISFHFFQDVLKLEIRRLVRQSAIPANIKTYLSEAANAPASSEEVINQMQAAVIALFDVKGDSNLINFLHWLEIADFLNRQPDHHAH